MYRRRLWLYAVLLLVLVAGSGDILAAMPAEQGLQSTPKASAKLDASTLLIPQLKTQLAPRELQEEERIAFVKDADLWLVRPDGTASIQLTTTGNVSKLYGWSYDCSQLLVAVGERPVMQENEVLGGSDLWVIQADGSGARPLVQGLEVLSAQWSPLAKKIAYGTRDGNIHLINSDGQGYRILLDDGTGFLGTWSPDGTEIAIQRTPAPMDYWTLNLAILDVATGAVRFPIPEEMNRVDYRPFLWSADGRVILFQSGRGEDGVWWQTNLEQGALLQVDGVDEFDVIASGVSRSPTADRVAFGYYRQASDVPTIWVMDLNGSNLWKLAEGANPAWSPDGASVAYAGLEGGLWVISADGSHAQQIVEQGQSALWFEPVWCR